MSGMSILLLTESEINEPEFVTVDILFFDPCGINWAGHSNCFAQFIEDTKFRFNS